MKSGQQKLKLMYLMKIFFEKTDEEHSLSVKQLIAELGRYGISAERKSLYDDIECLKQFGLDILSYKGKTTSHFLASRNFELPELKLLVDSVQASKFITEKKSLELISKLEKLTSTQMASRLHRQVYVSNRNKTDNERIYYNVDTIHEAIAENKQIRFKYFSWTLEKKKAYRKNGDFYIETPISLTFADENYYLIVYKQKYNDYASYRVDKMEDVSITEDMRIMPPQKFDLAAYSKKVFSMFGGEETEVSAELTNDMVNVIVDRFGLETPMIKTDDEHFIAKMKVEVSNQFLAWIIGLGNKAKIISPESVKIKIKKLLENTLRQY